jgi:hypothetical protein
MRSTRPQLARVHCSSLMTEGDASVQLSDVNLRKALSMSPTLLRLSSELAAARASAAASGRASWGVVNIGGVVGTPSPDRDIHSRCLRGWRTVL